MGLRLMCRWLRDAHPVCNITITNVADKVLRVYGTPMLDAAIDATRSHERGGEGK